MAKCMLMEKFIRIDIHLSEQREHVAGETVVKRNFQVVRPLSTAGTRSPPLRCTNVSIRMEKLKSTRRGSYTHGKWP